MIKKLTTYIGLLAISGMLVVGICFIGDGAGIVFGEGIGEIVYGALWLALAIILASIYLIYKEG